MTYKEKSFIKHGINFLKNQIKMIGRKGRKKYNHFLIHSLLPTQTISKNMKKIKNQIAQRKNQNYLMVLKQSLFKIRVLDRKLSSSIK